MSERQPLYKQLKQAVIEAKEEQGYLHLNGYAYKTTDGKTVIEPSRICFSYLSNTHSKSITDFIFSLAHAGDNEINKKCNKRMFNKFVQWCIKDSVFSDAFAYKRVSDCYRYGVKTNINKNNLCLSYIVVSLMFIRYAYEFPHFLPLWSRLVKDGVEPHIAMCIAQCFKKESKYYSHRYQGKGHDLFHHASKKLFNSFIKHGISKQYFNSGFRVFQSTNFLNIKEDEESDIHNIVKHTMVISKNRWHGEIKNRVYEYKNILSFALEWTKENQDGS